MENFHRLSQTERLARLQAAYGLTIEELDALSGRATLTAEDAEHLIENVVGVFPLPLGIATHFEIDGRELSIPMVVEETSIIAAASASAKWVTRHGRITTGVEGNLIIGQIQFPLVQDIARAGARILEASAELIALANAQLASLVTRGGGVRELVVRAIDRDDPTRPGQMLVLHVLCDPCDAMGANLINQVCEILKPRLEALTGEAVGLCILSNLVDGKQVWARVELAGVEPKVIDGIVEAGLFAERDPYRAATHNKGVMNGIDPVLIATGNDWRAVEAGVHAFAARSGRYRPITRWTREMGTDGELKLIGEIRIPLAVGTVGGMTRIHPTSRVALKILGVTHASELARVCAAVGLVQNLGALKALATVGIVKGHMQLHAANLAIAAGAEAHELPAVRERLSEILKTEKSISISRAQQVLTLLRTGESGSASGRGARD